MPFFNTRATLLAAGALLALSACNSGTGTVPTAAGADPGTASSRQALATPADTTSILKLLTKDVTIGSTVDLKNGDTGPRAISIVTTNYAKLKKGQILVCNFADSSGNAGKGTTIEQFDDTPSSKPTTFYQGSLIEGCDGDAITSGDQVYATGLTSKKMIWINQNGLEKKVYGAPITDPLGNGDGVPLYLYSPEYIFVGNADTGAVDNLSLGGYGTKKTLEVINGFPVNSGSGWSAQGPSGFAYDCGATPAKPVCKNKNDLLYIADGACNAIVQVQHATSLLEKDEITAGSGCKTFMCKYKSATCAKLIKAGSPLSAPVAVTLLPNENIIAANTGNNTLVEMTPAGKVLGTKVIDKSKTPGIFAIMANGTNDGNTVLFYTDTNTNTLHELEQ